MENSVMAKNIYDEKEQLTHITPLVSIIIPVHNRAQFVGKTVASILAQDFKDYEIIIVNDASTDNTAQVLSHFDDHVQVIALETNIGPAAARNLALEKSRGEMIAFLDSDDLWRPNMLSTTVSYLLRNPEIDLVCGACDEIDETGKRIRKVNWPSTFQPLADTDFLALLTLRGNLITVASLLIRRKCFECCGIFDTTLKRSMDWDLWLRMAGHGHKIAFIDVHVAHYRRHRGNITRDPQSMEQAANQILAKAFADHQTAARLSVLKEHAYISSWIRIAQLSREAGLEAEVHKFVRLAEEQYQKAPLNRALNLQYLVLLFSLPEANLFIQKIIASTPEAEPLYHWLAAKKYLQSKNYSRTILSLLKLITQQPTWLVRKIITGTSLRLRLRSIGLC
jgi:glycosyltransferase involved in cell wall biosynthesis